MYGEQSSVRTFSGTVGDLLEAQDIEVAEHDLRLQVDVDGLLARDDVYPTYWLRLWFTGPGGKGHQRGYTLVDPDPAAGTAWIEFFLHDGLASDWARRARPGDRIDATVLNGRDPLASAPPHLLLVGDVAAVPAIADTLRRAPDVPTTALIRRSRPGDEHVLPVRAHDAATVTWFDADETLESTALGTAASLPAGSVAVIALEGAPTRRLGTGLRRGLGMPKEDVHAIAYWKRS